MKKWLVTFLAVLSIAVMSVFAADEFVLRRTVPIAGSVRIPIRGSSVTPVYMTSVLLSFDAVTTNTFTVSYVRDTVDNILMSWTSTNITDVAWYVPARVYLLSGDVLVFSNSSVVAGDITYNLEQ